MDKNQDLTNRREASKLGGGEKRIERQHAQGKLTARERVIALLDEGSFNEIGQFVEHRSHSFGLEKNKIPGDGVVTGFGTIHGRLIYVFSRISPCWGAPFQKRMQKRFASLWIWRQRTEPRLLG